MKNIPNLLLIGAGDRNVGKTELACNLIRKFKNEISVIGIKITVIKKNDGKCPRGGEGCGVCSSLDSDYCITEEKDISSCKDTSRMLKAGACKVYWLRVLIDHLDNGVETLFNRIEKENSGNLCYISESNSARLVIDPGLFLIIIKKNSDFIKDSCRRVMKYADRIIKFDSETISHDISTDLILFNGLNWEIKCNPESQ